MMEDLTRTLGIVMAAIGLFLALFYGLYIKRRDVGPGMDNPEKRIAVYVALGIGAMFLGGGLVFLIILS